MSRLLKVGEEYARRLLTHRLGEGKATDVASRLVETYPEHGFIIDEDEARSLGLKPKTPSVDQIRIMDVISLHLDGLTAIGRVFERPTS